MVTISQMLIGKLADAVRAPTQTLRFYERERLLPEPTRAANGYRNYDESAITRVRFIRAAQAAGLSLVDIRSVLELRDAGHIPCAHVTTLITDKLADVRRRMHDLTSLETELSGLLDRSQDLDPAECTDADICHILATPPPTLGK